MTANQPADMEVGTTDIPTTVDQEGMEIKEEDEVGLLLMPSGSVLKKEKVIPTEEWSFLLTTKLLQCLYYYYVLCCRGNTTVKCAVSGRAVTPTTAAKSAPHAAHSSAAPSSPSTTNYLPARRGRTARWT